MKMLLFVICLITILTAKPILAQPFVHPGLLHNQADIDRMKNGVATRQTPLYAGFEIFQKHPQSQASYQMRGPMVMVGRNPTVGQGTYDTDANAAYQCALMWCITADTTYASTARRIVDGWSSTLTSITGRDAVLMAGLGPFKMVNAAELLRYTNSGWSDAASQRAEKHFKAVIYPVIQGFSPFANGNWDTAAIKTMLAIGIFCNDRPMVERALRYYVNGAGDGRLTYYVINETGQGQESGRDQAHAQLGIAHLGDCAEIAWHQGLDLYAYADNRLLKGFEYAANYNLGHDDLPFAATLDRTGKYAHRVISDKERGKLRAVYEQIYNHYVNRRGLAAPFTQQAAEKLRPEGPGLPGADHTGFGTLLYTRPATTQAGLTSAPAAPAGLIAQGSSGGNQLTWIAAVGATQYTVKRATKTNGPYTIIARKLNDASYQDKQAKAGQLYYYTVTARNVHGESTNAYPVGINTGLPNAWQQRDIGPVQVAGQTDFDGQQFTLEGAGTEIGGTSDQLQFAYRSLTGDGTITARYVPQVSSQFTQLGLMMRETLTSESPQATLLLSPESNGQVEAPGWRVTFLSRATTRAMTKAEATGSPLTAPVVTNGRLTGHFWFRLVRKGHTFTGLTSADGTTWTSVGSLTMPLNKTLYVGLPVCSRLPSVTTRVVFDQVVVTDES